MASGNMPISLSDAQREELARRRELHEADPARGRSWREVLEDIERRTR